MFSSRRRRVVSAYGATSGRFKRVVRFHDRACCAHRAPHDGLREYFVVVLVVIARHLIVAAGALVTTRPRIHDLPWSLDGLQEVADATGDGACFFHAVVLALAARGFELGSLQPTISRLQMQMTLGAQIGRESVSH
jgi:hypothetical protein